MWAQIVAKAKAFFSHSRTVFVARVYTFVGVASSVVAYVLPWFEGQDFTPVFARLFKDIPDDLRPLIISGAIVVTGELFVFLRKRTDESLEEKKYQAGEDLPQ